MIEWVVERLASLLPEVASLARDRRELADSAFESISRALTETSLYVKRYSQTGQREEATQADLARLWAAAAIPLRHVDRELSQICEFKSEYWVDPDHWNPDTTRGLVIDLDAVRERYRAQLN